MTYIQPVFPLLLLLTVMGVLFFRRRPRWLAVCALALLLFTFPPLARIPMRILEGRYPVRLRDAQGVQAIVVLAGEVLPPTASRAYAIANWDTYQRCVYASFLYQDGLHVPVLASGGGSGGSTAYAESMRVLLRQQGIPDNMIWTEDRSTSTYESARNSAGMLASRGIHKIALVTEAHHMLRSDLSFKKQGLDVVPAPCCFRSDPDDWFPQPWPSRIAIVWNGDAIHEFLGLAWYWVRGRV